MHLTQGNLCADVLFSCQGVIKLRAEEDPKAEKAQSGRFTEVLTTQAYETGNGVEDKTLSTGKETGRRRGRNRRTCHLWHN